MGIVQENLDQIQRQILSACLRSGRQEQEVQLVAITKTIPVALIREAMAAGIRVIGENRVQEAAVKFAEIGEGVIWHLVGHLQTNKSKRACEIFQVIESVDSIHLARELDDHAGQSHRVVEILLEVNTSAEESKYGIRPEAAGMLAREIALCRNIKLVGLMTVGAFLPDPQEVRPCFKILREIRDDLQRLGLQVPHLSMGMSNDFEVAIEEGATLIRLGRALFGERT